MRKGFGRGKLRKRACRNGGTVWQADWRDAQGRRRRKDLCANRADAERMLAKIIHARDLEVAGLSAERGLSMTLEEVAAEYLADLRTRARAGSIAGVETSLALLQRELGARTVRDITRPLVAAWRRRRVAAGASNKTANNYVAALHAALQFVVREGLLASNPISGIMALPIGAEHQRRKPRPLSEWEIGRLLAAAAAADRDAPLVPACGGTRAELCAPVPLEPLLRALLLTAARWGELTRVTWNDLEVKRVVIDGVEREVGILTLRAETTKTGKARAVPIDSELLRMIMDLPNDVARVRGSRPGPGDRIFVTRVGKPWSSSKHFGRWLDRMFKAAGIPKRDSTGRVVHVHALRHSAATRMARSGAARSVTQKYLGHASARMTEQVYISVDIEDVRHAIEGLPPLPSPAREQLGDAVPRSAQA